MWKWMGVVLKENHFLRCWGWLSLLNWIGALALSLLLILRPRKLEPWFVLWSFFLLRLLSISINLPYSHPWNTVVMSGLVLQVATCNCWISYKNGYELAELVPVPYSRGRSACYFDRMHDFSVTISSCYKDVYVNSFFPCTARHRSSPPPECLPLI